MTISVNLFYRQFSRPRLLLKQIAQILQESDLDACSLNLDIPNNVIQRNVGTTTATLSQLKALGVQLHIDNFGTGYSAVACLHRLPIDTLKIDRAFVSEMDKDDEHSQIVKASLNLAHNLNLDAIAIGVETAAELTQLKALKCKYGQGYFFSEPLDVNGVEALLTTEIGQETLPGKLINRSC